MRVFDETLRARLRSSAWVLGQFVQIPAPGLVEMVGYTGYDYVLIDNEHGPANMESTEHMIRAARASNIAPVVRVSDLNVKEILRTLDAGASGIMVPQINTPEEAEMAVRACRYQPRGLRGVATSTRAGGYSVFGGLGHLQASDEAIVTILQIETAQALENLDKILQVEGIDVIFIGPADLSASMGYPTNPGHPAVQAAIADAVGRINAAGVVPGIMVFDADGCRHWESKGARFISVGSTNLIVAAMQSLAKAARQK